MARKAKQKERPLIGFNSDRPIESAGQDRLSRVAFAKSIATCLSNWDGNDSLVVGLVGRWGCGKSSIKNLIKEAVVSGDKYANRRICEFVPWSVASEGKLTETFFDEIGRAIGRLDQGKLARARIRTLQEYRAKLSIGAFALRSLPLALLRKIISSILVIAGLASWKFQLIQFGFAAAIFVVAGLVALVSWFDVLLEKIIAFLEAKAKRYERSLSELKTELTAFMRGLESPIIMLIDEVDRLTEEELGVLFRLVKCNADFPNLIYLLLYDQKYVEDALTSFLPKDAGGCDKRGEDYLKKIVQVTFQVPEPSREQFEKVLFQGLDQVIESSGASAKFDKERWSLVYPDGLRPLFKTLRDVNRYLSSLEFYFGLFRGKAAFELDPVDLICLEAVRLFEANLYSRLASAKDDLIKTTTRIRFDDEREERKSKVREILKDVSETNREAVSTLLKAMFPGVAELMGGYRSSHGAMEEWFQKTQVCHEDFFDRYFTLNLPTDQLSDSEIKIFMAGLSDFDNTASAIRKYIKKGRLPFLLDALENYKNALSVERFEVLASCLMSIGDILPPRGLGLFGDDPRMTCTRIILFILSRMENAGKRIDALKNAFERTTDFVVPVHIVHILGKLRKEGWGDLGQLFESDEHFESLDKLLAQRINQAASSGTLRCSPRIASIFPFWKEHGGPAVQKTWIESQLKYPETTVQLLKGFTRTVSHSSRREIGWRISLGDLDEFVAPAQLDHALEACKPKSEADKLTIEIYRYSREHPEEKEGIFGDGDDYLWSDLRELY